MRMMTRKRTPSNVRGVFQTRWKSQRTRVRSAHYCNAYYNVRFTANYLLHRLRTRLDDDQFVSAKASFDVLRASQR